MKKIILLCLIGSSLWVFFASADSNDLTTSSLPRIQIGANGSLPNDGSECVQVDADGKARVIFVSPSYKKHQNDADGYDYVRQGLYFSFVQADRGSFNKQSTFIPSETSFYQEIISSENAGKTICFKLDHINQVPSFFELFARYFGTIGALRGLESVAGHSYQHFPAAGYPGAIPSFLMLHNQLEMGRDVRQLTELNTNAGSATTGLVSAGVLSSGYLFFPKSWYPPITELGTTGSFTLFHSAPIGDGLLIAVDDGVVTPYIGELISPANGTDRQPGSMLASHAFRGPVMLGNLYAGQNYWNELDGGKLVNKMPSIMVSLTIVTSHSSRTFIREISENFLGNGELLGYAHESLVAITVAAVDDPSNVMTIYPDEIMKGRATDLLNSYQHYSDDFKTQDSYAAIALYGLEKTIMWTPIFAGLLSALPYTSALLTYIGSHLYEVIPPVLIALFINARELKNGLSKNVANIMGNTGKAIAKNTGISHVAKFRPKTVGSGISMQPSTCVGKAMSLSFAFTSAGPAFRSMTRYMSNLMADLCEPGSMWHKTFQTSQQFVIGHTVMP